MNQKESIVSAGVGGRIDQLNQRVITAERSLEAGMLVRELSALIREGKHSLESAKDMCHQIGSRLMLEHSPEHIAALENGGTPPKYPIEQHADMHDLGDVLSQMANETSMENLLEKLRVEGDRLRENQKEWRENFPNAA